MKKLTLILLSLLLCFSAFACDGETDTSSNAESSAVVSDESFDDNETSSPIESDIGSDDSSDNSFDDSSEAEYVIPEFDINQVVYNPDEIDYGDTLEGKDYFYESDHIGLGEYIEANGITDEYWFPVELTCGFSMVEYLTNEVGIVDDQELTENWKDAVSLYKDAVYITGDMYMKLKHDNYPIGVSWLPKRCAEAGRCLGNEWPEEFE